MQDQLHFADERDRTESTEVESYQEKSGSIMSIEQDVIETLRILPPTKQEEVLRFVQSLQTSNLVAQKNLRLGFAEKILPDLQRIHRDRDEPPSPVYADSLIRTMRGMRDRLPEEPFTQIVMALHNAMTFESLGDLRWGAVLRSLHTASKSGRSRRFAT
ncbi:MAG: hypothetical protein HC780_09995 [Leptolyngbyaceae cyanobacterium CSU_1_3]|nr:hypothetical protein [Leptolyngbyaceae cyanobacterium CSU_1_3]